jgi:hypothetical protein
MRRDVTMLELVTAVTEHTRTEGEAIATIVHMVNSGAVRLCGIFSGAGIDLREVDQPCLLKTDTDHGAHETGSQR